MPVGQADVDACTWAKGDITTADDFSPAVWPQHVHSPTNVGGHRRSSPGTWCCSKMPHDPVMYGDGDVPAFSTENDIKVYIRLRVGALVFQCSKKNGPTKIAAPPPTNT